MTFLEFQASNPKSKTDTKRPAQKPPSPPPSPRYEPIPPLRGEGAAVQSRTLAPDGKGEGSVNPDEQLRLEAREEGKHFTIRVTSKDQGKRLDQFLSQIELNLSRSQAKKMIEEKFILLNQKSAKPSVHLKQGDLISGTVPKPKPLSLKPEPTPLNILYEDPSIIVVDKPAGMVVHPAAGNPSGTLVNALLYHCQDLSGINGVLRPGIVHRLDKDTSGVMVVAKDDEAYHHLLKQFKNRTVEKVYVAIAYGKFSQTEGLIDLAIGRHPKERKRMSTRTNKGRVAITRWKRIENLDGFSLLEIYPQTGRTHQIRVHLSSMGHPVLGDPLYGRKGRPGSIQDSVLKECVRRMSRQALHARRLTFHHPRTGQKIQFEAPLPEDMQGALEWLRSQINKIPPLP
jgi:23S rRNA pseudouridine1911/1915/1917 synthase